LTTLADTVFAAAGFDGADYMLWAFRHYVSGEFLEDALKIGFYAG